MRSGEVQCCDAVAIVNLMYSVRERWASFKKRRKSVLAFLTSTCIARSVPCSPLKHSDLGFKGGIPWLYARTRVQHGHAIGACDAVTLHRHVLCAPLLVNMTIVRSALRVSCIPGVLFIFLLLVSATCQDLGVDADAGAITAPATEQVSSMQDGHCLVEDQPLRLTSSGQSVSTWITGTSVSGLASRGFCSSWNSQRA